MVSPAEFHLLVGEAFGKPNPGSAFERTMMRAVESGKIQSGEAGFSTLRKELQIVLGTDVDFSYVKIGGPFDPGVKPQIAVPKPEGN